MNTILKSQILDKKTFESNQIGPLAYLVHKMSGQGDFSVKVTDGKIQKLQFTVNCSTNNKLNSMNIDVSETFAEPKQILLNSDNGHLLFYNSKEFCNLKIEIIKVSAKNELEFDSLKPSLGDLMVLNILKPGRYSIKSSTNQSHDIEVQHPEKIVLQPKMVVPINNFSHADFSLTQRKILNPNQGIIFEFSKEMSSFTVNLVEEKTASSPFDNRIRDEFKAKFIKEKTKTTTIQKKYQWSEKIKPTR